MMSELRPAKMLSSTLLICSGAVCLTIGGLPARDDPGSGQSSSHLASQCWSAEWTGEGVITHLRDGLHRLFYTPWLTGARAPTAEPSEAASRINNLNTNEDHPMILLIDNYDSFTYNLVQRFGEIDPTLPMTVVRNDQITLDEIAELKPTHIIISPGPCTPREAGVSNDVLKRFAADACRSSASASGTSASATSSAARWSATTASCTARRRRSTTTARASSPGCPTRSRRRATTAWSSSSETLNNPDFVVTRLDRRGRDHGRAAQDVAAARRPVPPRELPDGRGAPNPAELPGTGPGAVMRLNAVTCLSVERQRSMVV